MTDGDSHSLPDESHIRRFALAVGLILLGFTLAGGQILGEVHGGVLNVKFDRPNVLLLFLFLTSVYATYRYWYFAIKVPVSRTAIRRYLKQTDSILVFKGQEQAYRDAIMQVTVPHARSHVLLEEKCPPGHTPFEFIIYTDARTQATAGYVRHLVANRIHDYFPGITRDEVTTRENDDISWATVNNLKVGTKLRAFLEDLDHWAPVIINGIAILAFLHWFYCRLADPFFSRDWFQLPSGKGEAMSTPDMFLAVYILGAIVLSCYYAYRGYKGNWFAWTKENIKREPKLTDSQIITVFCIHDALFHFLCSLAGFVALLVAIKIYQSIDFAQAVDPGRSLLLASSFLFGFIGATGQLPQLILQGKLPFVK